MLTRLVFVINLLFVYINGQYRGGFGPRLPDSNGPQMQTRADNYADMLTKNNQQRVSEPLIPVAAPTIYRAPGSNAPIYLSGPTPQIPLPLPSDTSRPFQQQLSNDLSRVPKPAQTNPYSQRDKLFGIKPLPDPRSNQPFNPTPNLFEQPNRPAVYAQQNQQFNPQISPGVIETVTKDLHVYPAKVDHQFVGSVGAPIQNNRPQIDVPLTPNKVQKEIGRFDSNVNRFANDNDVKQRQRIVLPMDLANAPIESFLRRVDPYQKVKPVVSVGTQSANANTQILTSDIHVNEQETTTFRTPLQQGHTLPPETATPFTTYPDYRAEFFPELINHAHDDKRPATGRRVGDQGRFGGGTNEYREDLGIRTFGINDQRRPWEQYPGRFAFEATNKPPNADHKDVVIETLRNTNPKQPPQSSRLDQDLSKTQPFSQIAYSKFDNYYPEVITPAPKSRETTTIVGAPLYPEFGTGYHGKSGKGPANEFLNKGISPPEFGSRIELGNVDDQLGDGLRPYNGPEEITRSRYRGIDTDIGINKNKNFKLDLLNE